jgi:Abnormal spindle-like microcephaly-assoc'd, ASPM-SPD-2-Hydin
MRLPQSITHYLSVRSVHLLTQRSALVLLASVFLGMAAVRASAADTQLVCTPSKLRFGAVVVGQTQTLLVTLTNNGQTSVTLSGITVGNSVLTTSYMSLPLVLPAGQSVGLSVNFSPTAAGWTDGKITFSSNASNSVLRLEADGSGVNGPSITANPSAVSFGQVAIGSVSTTPVVLTNVRSYRVSISALQVTGSGFLMSGATFPLTLGGGQSVTVNVGFAPHSAGTTGGTLLFSGPQLVIPLTGTGTPPGQLTANPASLTFGSVQVGGNLALSDSFTNTGGSSVTISQVTIAGAGFGLSGLNVPLTLNPGASVTFSGLFAPQSAGNVSGAITVVSNAPGPNLTVSLTGTGTAQGQLTLTPTSSNFGNTTVGTSVSQTGTLNASGTSVSVSSANLNGAEFSLSGISFPVTIAAGQSVPFTLTFAPQATGSASAVLSVSSNASNSPTGNLSGVGTSPTQHSVSLSWTESGSGIVGYNVYRSGTSGGPYTQINSGLDPSTAYTDSSVVSGQTYYYVATSVEGNGMESTYSNETQGVIPTP